MRTKGLPEPPQSSISRSTFLSTFIIETWGNLSAGVRQHLIDRMRDRAISITDLNHLRLWIDSNPEAQEGDWYKDFGSFKICGTGSLPKTFLARGQAAKGKAV